MGVALNTVGVSASVDDNGRIIRWFDKEAAVPVLAEPWTESLIRSPAPPRDILWEIETQPANRPTFIGTADEVSCSKQIRTSYRAMEVTIGHAGGPGVTMLSEFSLAVPSAQSMVLAERLDVETSRVIVTATWEAAVAEATMTDTESGICRLRFTGVGPRSSVVVSVRDR